MKFEWPENRNFIRKLRRGRWGTTNYQSSLSFHNLVHGTNSQVTRTRADGDLLALTLSILDTNFQTVVMSSDSQPLVVFVHQGLFHAWNTQSQKKMPDICWETLNIRVTAGLDQLMKRLRGWVRERQTTRRWGRRKEQVQGWWDKPLRCVAGSQPSSWQ